MGASGRGRPVTFRSVADYATGGVAYIYTTAAPCTMFSRPACPVAVWRRQLGWVVGAGIAFASRTTQRADRIPRR